MPSSATSTRIPSRSFPKRKRDVTVLFFALAGYLVHDIHETVPVFLLDSLKAIDSDRIAGLIAYVEYAAFVIAALLLEDAEALAGTHHRLRKR